MSSDTVSTDHVAATPAAGPSRGGSLRFNALGGIGFVALQMVSIVLEGTPPRTDAPAADIAAYFRDHAGSIKGAELVGAIGVIALLAWLVGWWQMSHDGEDVGRMTVATAALGVTLTLALLHGALLATAALRAEALGPQTLPLFTLSYVVILTGGVGLVAFLALAAGVNHRVHAFPRWTDAVAVISAAAFLVGTIGTASTATALEVFGYVSFLAWCVWIIATAVSMWRGPARFSPPPASST